MKKIIAVVLAAAVFVSGFCAGNAYRSICKAETVRQTESVTEEKTEAMDTEEAVISDHVEGDTEEVVAQDGAETESEAQSEAQSETQSETVAVGLESAQISAEVKKSNSGTQLTDFDIIEQYPELPTGCEITAMTMVLNYYGYQVNKVTMALDYMPKVQAEFYHSEDGRLMGPDLENFFVGDPTEETGYICGTGAIVTAANRYLADVGSDLTAAAMKNVQPKKLYDLIDQGTPVVIWCTINMEDRAETDGWYREDGTYMEWSTNDHGAVLIGYDEDTVTVADPIYSRITVSRDQFEKVFAERGGQCVILQ